MSKRLFKTMVALLAIAAAATGPARAQESLSARHHYRFVYAKDYVRKHITDEHADNNMLRSENNEFYVDPNLWCYNGDKDGKILIGRLEGKATQACINNNTVDGNKHLWAFVLEPTLKRWKEICKQPDPRITTEERMYEFLGLLGVNHAADIVIFEVNVSDIFRPAYQPSVREVVKEEYVKLLVDPNRDTEYLPLNIWGNPNSDNQMELQQVLAEWRDNLCTRVGYTFDYSKIDNADFGPNDYIGAPEIIVRCKAKIKFKKRVAISDLHLLNIEDL